MEDTLLITGGAGFIGSHLVERLVASGNRVVNLDLLTYAGNPDNLAALDGHERHIFVRGDIGDRALVRSLLSRHRPRIVFNLAAESHVDRSIDKADPFFETNVTGVCRLLDTCLAYWRGLDAAGQRAFRYIQMSTDEVYGSIAEGAFTEESNYAPNSPYAASKAAGDHFTRAFGATYGLPVSVVHASNTYGPRQYPEKLIPHMIIAALAGRPLPVYGKGANVRDWLHVGDLVRGLEQLVTGGAGRDLQFRRRRRVEKHRRGARALRASRRARAGRAAACRKDHVCCRSPRPRSALRHGKQRDVQSLRLASRVRLRGRSSADRLLVSREPCVVAEVARPRLRARAHRRRSMT